MKHINVNIIIFMMIALVFDTNRVASAANATKPAQRIVRISKRISAKIDLFPDHAAIRFAPRGKTQKITEITRADAEGHYRLVTNDFNFDGYQDIAFVGSPDGVTDNSQILLYDARRHQFVPLEVDGGRCDWLSTITLDRRNHTLYSACRGAGWAMDAYRYNPADKIYLYQTTQGIENDNVEALLGVKRQNADVPIGGLLTYDSAINIIGCALAHVDNLPIVHPSIYVSADRLPPHNKPENADTQQYLIKGDRVQAEDVSDDEQWIKVVY